MRSYTSITAIANEALRLPGNFSRPVVPVLVLDEGEVVTDSKNIAAWARDNPATDAR